MEAHGVIEVEGKGPMDAYVATVTAVDRKAEFLSVEIINLDVPDGVSSHIIEASRACTFVKGRSYPRLKGVAHRLPQAGDMLVCSGFQDEEGDLEFREYGFLFDHAEIARMMKGQIPS